jgi:hypothetical protein
MTEDNTINSNFKIRHYRSYEFPKNSLTVISNLTKHESGSYKFEYAVAYCNKNDQFSKKIGVRIAMDHYISQDEKYYKSFEFKNNAPIKSFILKQLILTDILCYMEHPHWASKLIISLLDDNQL